ncbi:MAG: 30S ribosomal protein S8 [Lentisphaerae bacterium]|jgi:small subunit ribosomal protein S8|nr:30S ribosomal protein S8 [Lentisphaerota bacterium]
MSWSDPIADMLTRIRNAQNARLPDVTMPASRMKSEIARILQDEGFISAVTSGDPGRREMRLTLKYTEDGEPVIRGLRRDSRPGLRRYCGQRDIPRVLGGMGIAILSTSAGIMTGKEARRRKLGGEVLCSIW